MTFVTYVGNEAKNRMLSVDIDPQFVLQVVLATPDQSIHFFNFALNLTVATAFTNSSVFNNCVNLSKLRRLFS